MFSKMAALLLFVCVILACKTQAQILPPQPCNPPPLCNLPPKICNPPPKICNPPPQICVPPPCCNPPPKICNPLPQICIPPPQICNPPPQICNPLPQICNPPPCCNPPPQICTNSPQVITVVDNTVSNSLANAIQLLIVSNLLENTMKPCGCSPVSVCDPIQTVYSPTIDCLVPQIDYNPYNPYDPIISPCDIIAPCPCDPIEIVPKVCYPDVWPIGNVGCGCDVPNYGLATIVPNCGCGYDCFGPNVILPNVGCGCDCCGPTYGLPNMGCGCDCCGPKYCVPNGCGCDKYTIQNFGLPNIGCGCDSCGPKFGIQNVGYDLLSTLVPRCGCDGPMYPCSQNCNCGCFPNLPVGINVESLGFIDSCGCPNKCGIYY